MDGRKFHHFSRDLDITRMTYTGRGESAMEMFKKLTTAEMSPSPYTIYWGEIHGHTELSDGAGSPDDYFSAARNEAKLDFCAVTDHDHGGLNSTPLWDEKWEQTQAAVARWHEEGRFVTLLGYERDSYPWYSNLCLYYRDGRAEMVRGEEDGRITRSELEALLARDDVIAIPHHTSCLSQGVHFDAIPPELFTPLTEIYSKWGTQEFFGNPEPVHVECRGGYWQDALECGARMGVVGGSDVHSPHPGLYHEAKIGHLRHPHPGLVAVLATELTREAIFDALKARRCYAASGARIAINFQINGAVMGQEIAQPQNGERKLALHVNGQTPLQRVTLVKNSQDYIIAHVNGESDTYQLNITDLKAERKTDYYYVRVEQANGRRAWSSPIWITQ